MQTVGTILLMIGLVGHVLSITTVAHNRKMRRQTSGIFIISLSAVGLLTLYTGLLRSVIRAYTLGEYDIRSNSDGGCRIHLFLTYLSLHLFAWLQAAVALDRFVAVCTPIRYKTFSQQKWGWAIVGILCLMACALNTTMLVSGGLSKEEPYSCTTHIVSLHKAWPYMDLLSFSIIPAILITIFNVFILHRILRNKTSSKLKQRARSLTIMLMTVNLIFLVSTVPVSIVLIVDIYHPLRTASSLLWYTCMSLLQYAGTASTFFVYCLTGTRFRQELIRIFACKKQSSDSGAAGTTDFCDGSMPRRRCSTMESRCNQHA